MTLGADSIYRVTVVAQVGSEVQYKYLNGNAWGSDEGVPAACGAPNGLGGYNRAFVVPAANTSLEVHCFASCEACTTVGPMDCTAGDCCGEGTIWDSESGTCVVDGMPPSDCAEDLNGDGTVAVADILQLLGAFGMECD